MWQPQEMATEPPRRTKSAEAERFPRAVQLDEPPSPPASAEEDGGKVPFFNGCVPLSHQVAGHMYGKDKGGKSASSGGVRAKEPDGKSWFLWGRERCSHRSQPHVPLRLRLEALEEEKPSM
uniref:Uncharacterized protein n=1 Tax=Sphaerodactylus townsendi TaxID=933632 RepID=A0ACB8F8D6_9SAUR